MLLGVSVHNFSAVYQKLFNLNKKEGLSSLKNFVYYLNLFNDKEFSLCDVSAKREFYQGVIKGPLENRVIRSLKQDPEKKDIEKTLEMHYSKENLGVKTDVQMYFLRKIVNLCKENSVNIIFLSTPVHNYYKEKIPAETLVNFYHITQEFDVPKINYLKYETPDSLMSDGNHLNIKGAEYYSNLISDEIDKILN